MTAAGIDAGPVTEADDTAVGAKNLDGPRGGERRVQLGAGVLNISVIVRRLFQKLRPASVAAGAGDVDLGVS